MNQFKGIFPALLTPFGKDNKIDENALEALIKMNINKGVTGFYVGGSTAEAFLLSMEERKQVYEIAAGAAGGKCTLIAHVGCIATEHALALADHAAKLGYDAVSSVAPFYYKFSFPEIKKYYFDIVASVDLPMIVYNFPSLSGVSLSAESIEQFLRDDRFIGVKHTSNDFFALEQIKSAFPEKLVYNGYDEMFLAGLAMGADGGIGSTYNFMSEKFVRIQALFHEGKISEAQEIQKKINIIISALCKVGVFQGEKAILNEMGIPFGKCRAPFEELSSAQRDDLIQTVAPLL